MVFTADPAPPEAFLSGNPFVDTGDAEVRALARRLRAGTAGDAGFARAAFEWVRDEVAHSYDAHDPRVTLTAGEVLTARVGLCYAKAHLLAAVLRIGRIPTALCYQRLAHSDGHVLHGLVAVHLDGAWHRQDPRGNNAEVDAQFSLGAERIAWNADPARGEVDYPALFDAPAPCIVETLDGAEDVLALYGTGLPSALEAPAR